MIVKTLRNEKIIDMSPDIARKKKNQTKSIYMSLVDQFSNFWKKGKAVFFCRESENQKYQMILQIDHFIANYLAISGAHQSRSTY